MGNSEDQCSHEAKGSVSCSVISDSLQPHGPYSPWNSPGQNTGLGNLSLLQGIFPTQGLNPVLLHCRQILYQLSHKEISELWQLEQKSFHSKLSFRLDSFHKKLHSHPILHMKASTMLWVKMNFFSTYCK